MLFIYLHALLADLVSDWHSDPTNEIRDHLLMSMADAPHEGPLPFIPGPLNYPVISIYQNVTLFATAKHI